MIDTLTLDHLAKIALEQDMKSILMDDDPNQTTEFDNMVGNK